MELKSIWCQSLVQIKNIEQENKINLLLLQNTEQDKEISDLLRDNRKQTEVMEHCAILATVMFQKYKRAQYSLIRANYTIRST